MDRNVERLVPAAHRTVATLTKQDGLPHDYAECLYANRAREWEFRDSTEFGSDE
jgi:hypothetical protein